MCNYQLPSQWFTPQRKSRVRRTCNQRMYASVLMWPMKPADNGTWIGILQSPAALWLWWGDWKKTDEICNIWNINTYQLYVGLPLIFMSNKDFSEFMYQCVRKTGRNRATWQSFDLISNVTYGDITLLNSWNQTNPNKHLKRLVLPVTWHSKFIQPVSSSPLEPVSNQYMCTFTDNKVLTEINYRPIYLMSLVNLLEQ